MNDGVLNDEQIAALVAAARGGESIERRREPRTRRARRVREIDFSRPSKVPPDQQRRLERAHDGFCRTVATRLSAELLTPIELEVIAVDQLTWSSAVAQVPTASIAAVVEMQPIGTQLLMTCEQPLIMRLVERLLGGTAAVRPPLRELTEIESALARRLLTGWLAQLSATWQELADVQLSLGALEPQLANVSLAPPSEPTLTLTIEAKMSGTSSTISLVIPWRSIEPVQPRLSAGQYGEAQADPTSADALRAGLAGVDVEVRAEIASRHMSVDEVLTLAPGSLLRFGVPADAGVTLFTGDVPAHRGRPGRNGSRRAVQVLERLENPS